MRGAFFGVIVGLIALIGGFIVEGGNPTAFLDAVLALGADSELAAQLAANGRRYRETVLSQTAAIEHWARIVDDAAVGRRRTVAGH